MFIKFLPATLHWVELDLQGVPPRVVCPCPLWAIQIRPLGQADPPKCLTELSLIGLSWVSIQGVSLTGSSWCILLLLLIIIFITVVIEFFQGQQGIAAGRRMSLLIVKLSLHLSHCCIAMHWLHASFLHCAFSNVSSNPLSRKSFYWSSRGQQGISERRMSLVIVETVIAPVTPGESLSQGVKAESQRLSCHQRDQCHQQHHHHQKSSTIHTGAEIGQRTALFLGKQKDRGSGTTSGDHQPLPSFTQSSLNGSFDANNANTWQIFVKKLLRKKHLLFGSLSLAITSLTDYDDCPKSRLQIEDFNQTQLVFILICKCNGHDNISKGSSSLC